MQAFKDGELVEVTAEEFIQSLHRHAGWADEEFKCRSDPASSLGMLMTQAANELDRLNAELDIMRAKFQMAESLLALGGIDVDAHGAVVELAKETMGKLIAAERKIAELRLNQT